MKQLKRIFSALLALALILSCAPQLPLRAEAATVASGTCGDNVTWTLDDAGTLTISGTGAMKEYTSSSNEPWYSVRIDVKKVVIKNGVTTIDSYAFYNCYSLTSVEIPNSVTTIGEWAFANCVSLTSVEIPDSVTTIGEYAFPSCNSLTSVEIPASVTTIGDYAFYGCDSLTEIRVDPNNPNYSSEDWVLFNKDKTKLIQFPGGKGGAYTVPSSVTTIGTGAFKYCTSLTSVEMGDSVTTIGEDAFYGCYSLTSVEIPDSVTTIGEWTFRDCDSLTSVEIPDSVTEIGDYAFYFCDSLTSVEIPSSVTTIGQYAFAGCKKLTGIFFEGSAPKIGSSAFQYVTATAYYYPDETWTSTKMGNYGGTITWVAMKKIVASGECGAEGDNVKWELYDDGLLRIFGTGAMKGYSYTIAPWYSQQANVKKAAIENGVTTIGDSAFSGCTSLTSVEIGDSVTTIGIYAFYSCDSLTSVEIPASVTTIGDGAFYNCANLTNVEMGDSVTTIGDSAFYDCTSLTSVEIPASVTTIGSKAFGWCDSLIGIQVDPNNPNYSSEDGVLFNKAKTTVIQFPSGKGGAYIIPASVTTIGDSAFYDCASLTSVEMGDSVTTIGEEAFYDCTSLTSVEIPASVTTIGDLAFYSCDSLTSVEIPDSVTTIGSYAFAYCDSLTSMEIPASVTTIGNDAFRSCDSLTEIWFEGSAPTIGENAFSSVTATAYYYPDESWTSDKLQNYGGTITWVALQCEHDFGDDRVCDKCGWRLGDFDGNDVLDRSDVDYLLWHTIYGNELYPVGEEADLDGDGAVTDKDVNLLLLLILFPGWNLQG